MSFHMTAWSSKTGDINIALQKSQRKHVFQIESFFFLPIFKLLTLMFSTFTMVHFYNIYSIAAYLQHLWYTSINP